MPESDFISTVFDNGFVKSLGSRLKAIQSDRMPYVVEERR